MATLLERRLGYHSRAGLEPGTSKFATLRLNHYAARGMQYYSPSRSLAELGILDVTDTSM
jgi:hypothetical protein